MKHIILSAMFVTLLCSSGCSHNNRIVWLTEDAQQAEMVLYLPYFTPHHLNNGLFVTHKMQSYVCTPQKNSVGCFLVFNPIPRNTPDEWDYRDLSRIPCKKVSGENDELQFSQSWITKLSKNGKTLDITGYRYGQWGITELYELSGTQIAPNCWGGTGLYSFGGMGKIPDDFKRFIKFNWQLEPKTDKPKEFDEKFRTIILLRELPKTTGLD